MKLIQLALVSSIVLASSSASAFDVKRYMSEQCSSCHGTEVYTRNNRRVQNLPALKAHLRDRCNHVVTEKMDGQMLDAMVNYLNKNYYKF